MFGILAYRSPSCQASNTAQKSETDRNKRVALEGGTMSAGTSPSQHALSSPDAQGCDVCFGEHFADHCPHFDSAFIVEDRALPTKARLTLPSCLVLKTDTVLAKEKIPKGARFGPLQGPRRPVEGEQGPSSGSLLFEVFEEDGSSTCIETWDENKCNWMCLVGAAKDDDQQNLVAYQVRRDVYFGARRDIKAREELRVWYAPNYGRKMGVGSLERRQGPSSPAKKRRGRPRTVRPDPTGNDPPPAPVASPTRGSLDEHLPTRTTRKRKARADSDYIYYEKPPVGGEDAVAPSGPEESDGFDRMLEEMAKGEACGVEPTAKRGWKKGRKRKWPSADDADDVVPVVAEGTEEVVVVEVEDLSEPRQPEGEARWTCSVCSESYGDTALFAVHLGRHFLPVVVVAPKDRVAFPCRYCRARPRTPRLLHRHKILYHLETTRALRKCYLAKGSMRTKNEAAREILKRCGSRKNISDADAASILLQIEADNLGSPFTIDAEGVAVRDGTEAESFRTIGPSYSCDICCATYDGRLALFHHLREHAGDLGGVGVFSRKLTVQRRRHAVREGEGQASTRGGAFECRVCRKTFSKPKYLEKHFPVHTGTFACSVCSKWLRSGDSLANHTRVCGQVSEMETKGFATCPNCRAEFTDVGAFRRHMYEHTHAFACSSCDARFRNGVGLSHHVCQAALVLRCAGCGDVFPDSLSLDAHQCPVPGGSASRSTRDPVVRGAGKRGPRGPRKRPGLSPLVCEVCSSRFSSTSSLNVHRKLHGEKRFCCDVCGKKFHRRDLMLEHKAVHGAPAVPCPVCDKMFKTKKSLDVHLLIHDGTKRFSCPTCGKRFYQKGNLLKHEETHNPGRRYACQHCDKSFGTKEYLAIHVLEHTRGRIYQCSMCEKNFVKEHQLKAHQRIFHSNVAYVCKFCGLTVKLRHSLKRHLEKKHADLRHEWELATATRDSQQNAEDAAAAMSLVSSEEAVQGAEVLLAVAGIDPAALQRALAAGTACVRRGSDPNTIEISVGADDGGGERAFEHIEHLPEQVDQPEDSVQFCFEVNPVGGEESAADQGLLETGTVVVETAEECDDGAEVLLYVLTAGDPQQV